MKKSLLMVAVAMFGVMAFGKPCSTKWEPVTRNCPFGVAKVCPRCGHKFPAISTKCSVKEQIDYKKKLDWHYNLHMRLCVGSSSMVVAKTSRKRKTVKR